MRRLESLCLLGVLFVFSSCSDTDPDAGTARSRAALLSGAGDARLVINDEWPTGYCARVELENTGSANITSWTVVIDANDGTIGGVWKGQASKSGTLTTVTPYDYNSVIRGGATTDFGFCGTKAGDNPLPSLVSLAVEGGDDVGTGGTGGAGTGTAGAVNAGTGGTETGGTETGGTETGGTETGGTETGGTETGGTGGTTESPSPLVATLSVTTDWGSGYCGSVTLRNEGDTDLSDWSVVLSVPNATVNNIWNGAHTVAGNQITVAPVAHNSLIRPDSEVGFGFCTVTTGPQHTPTLVSADAERDEDPGTGGTGTGGTGTGGTGTGGTGTGGTETGGTGTGGTGDDPNPLTVTLSMQSDWGSGYCAAFVVSNTSDAEVSSWAVDVNVPNATIQNIWDGASDDPSPGVVTISAAEYNDLILPGRAATFGYCALTSAAPYLPSVVSVEAE